MNKILFFIFLTVFLSSCTSGSLTDQFFSDLSQSNGAVEVEVTQHLEGDTAGEITPEGSKLFTNDLGYEIELKEAVLHLHELNLLSEGSDPLCQGGFDQTIPLQAKQDLLEEDEVTHHMGTALIPMVFFCQFDLVLGSDEAAAIKFHEGEVHEVDTATQAFDLAGTWRLGGESGEFDLIGATSVSIQGAFKTEENGQILEHPLHFHDGETVISVLFATEYNGLFNGVDFKSQGIEAQLETIYQNIPGVIHQDVSDHHH